MTPTAEQIASAKMPSQKSMEKAREIAAQHDPILSGDDRLALANAIAQALDDRTEECAKIAAAHRLAWREKSNLTEASRERRDYDSMSIAAAHVESSIRSSLKDTPDA